MNRRLRTASLAGLLICGVWQTGGALYIHAKAALAQRLLRGAWAATLEGGRQVRPWPWADTWPVARLIAPGHGVDLIVLAGASGSSLAFAPGHLDGSADFDAAGTSVIAGHRDTHFAFLRELRIGEAILLQGPDGRWRLYRLSAKRVVDSRRQPLALAGDERQLLLLTCYPFDALSPGGPLRFLAVARPVLGGAARRDATFDHSQSPTAPELIPASRGDGAL